MPITARRPHRQTAWGLRHGPLPTEAYGRDEDPYSDEAFADELEQFLDKVVISGLSPHRQMAFLYSHNKLGGEDVGFGKTATMLKVRTTINEDLGASLLDGAVDDEDRVPIGAAYASFNMDRRTGYYPVLAEAVRDATTGNTPLLTHAHRRIAEAAGDDSPDAIRRAISISQVTYGVSLRRGTVEAFCGSGAAGVAEDLAATSSTTKLRSGNQWLDFLLIALHAADIKRLFLFIDQLEDLATNKSQSRNKRYKEIGRIRDLLEDEPGRSMLHTTFTFHDQAASDLEEFWTPHRLPDYHLRRANMGQIVLLEGLKDDKAAADVLGAWLSTERAEGFTGAPYLPFEMSAIRALREYAEGRVGRFLVLAGKVFDAAESDRLESIDDTFTRALLNDGSFPAADSEDFSEVSIPADDDLLA
jgi:hypothetical protein